MTNMLFSQAAENNKSPISEIIKLYIKDKSKILEIGSGTGQHVSYFSHLFPKCTWQPSDVECKLSLNDLITNQQSNILKPISLNVSHKQAWPLCKYDLVYTANTSHIMSWPEVILMIEMVADILNDDGLFICYSPFKFKGEFTTKSNHNFDDFLKQQKSSMGIRDCEAIKDEASKNKILFLNKHDMPANNHILVFQKNNNSD